MRTNSRKTYSQGPYDQVLVTLAHDICTYILIYIIGILTGLASGVLSTGGGTIIVPTLTEIFGIKITTAVATSVTAMIFTSASSTVGHIRRGNIHSRTSGLLMLSGIPMVVIGAYTTKLIPSVLLRTAFAAVLIMAAVLIVLSIIRAKYARDTVIPTVFQALTVGAAGGFTSGFLGIGGSVVMVPLLILAVGMDAKMSVSTVAPVVFVNALFGASMHMYLGHVDIILAFIIAAATVPGAQAGVRIFGHLESRTVKYIYAIFLVLIAVKMIFF